MFRTAQIKNCQGIARKSTRDDRSRLVDLIHLLRGEREIGVCAGRGLTHLKRVPHTERRPQPIARARTRQVINLVHHNIACTSSRYRMGKAHFFQSFSLLHSRSRNVQAHRTSVEERNFRRSFPHLDA
jgi:hypothetical protein